MTKIIDYIEKLPQDIKLYIYKNYIEPNLLLEEYKNAIKNIKSVRLDIIVIRSILPVLYKNEIVINYLRNECKIFNIVHREHKIENKKNFKLLNNGDSFCLSLLYYLYH